MSTEYVQQFTLFNTGLDLNGVLEELEDLMIEGKQAFNTIKGYAQSYKAFARWCEESGHMAFPADQRTVKLFIAWVSRFHKIKLSHLTHILSAIRDRHLRANLPSPVTRAERDLVTTIARRRPEEPVQKEPITPQQLLQIVKRLDDSPRALRDKALLTFGFASSWRRSEIASLQRASLRLTDQGMTVKLGKSKGDQVGKGREISIPYANRRPALCPVRAMEAWLAVRGNQPGPLFYSFYRSGQKRGRGINGAGINFVVKRSLQLAGIEPKTYGAHSLRSGMLTAAAKENANPIWMMKRSGHASMNTMDRYIRAGQAFEMDPLARVL